MGAALKKHIKSTKKKTGGPCSPPTKAVSSRASSRQGGGHLVRGLHQRRLRRAPPEELHAAGLQVVDAALDLHLPGLHLEARQQTRARARMCTCTRMRRNARKGREGKEASCKHNKEAGRGGSQTSTSKIADSKPKKDKVGPTCTHALATTHFIPNKKQLSQILGQATSRRTLHGRQVEAFANLPSPLTLFRLPSSVTW